MQEYVPTPEDSQQLEIAVSEHLFDNLLYLAHKKGLIDINEADNSTVLTVSLLTVPLFNSFTGYNNSSPCKVHITSLDPFPDMIIHQTKSAVNADLQTEILCKH